MKNFYLKPEVNILDVENLVFFDIDSTITSSADWESYIKPQHLKNPDLKQKIKNQVENKWTTISWFDSIQLNPYMISLFAEFLKSTNSKAVCISSWVDLKNPDLNLKELSELFSSIADFDDGWLIGLSEHSHDDRRLHSVLPWMDFYNFNKNFVILDDSGFNFSSQENVITVDGWLGFTMYDFFKAAKILGLEEIKGNFNHYYQIWKNDQKS